MTRITTTAIALGFLLAAGGAAAQGLDDVDNQADINHPNIHDNVGDGNNANPNGVSPAGGGNLHGIANNPGQSGTNPNDDGTNGFANQLNDVHGGIGDVNQNVD